LIRGVRYREAPGTVKDWLSTDKATFSNFRFVDERFRSHTVLRRILSLARKHQYQSILIESLQPDCCAEDAEESDALAIRCPKFSGSEVYRLSLFRGPPNKTPQEEDLIGYVLFKSNQKNWCTSPKNSKVFHKP